MFFIFYQFLTGRLWEEILTAKVWWKSVKSWHAPIFSWRQHFATFLHGGPVQMSRYSAGESPHKKAGRPAATSHLGTAWGDANIFKEENIARSGRSHPLWTLPGQNSKKMLRRTCTLSAHAPTLCWCIYFVGTNILSTPNFCRRQYFVNAYMLRMTIYWTY